MTETSTSSTTGGRFSAAPVPLIVRRLIYAGAAGPLLLLLAVIVARIGATLWHWAALWRGGAMAGLGAMAETVVFVGLWVLIGGWMLLPYWGALRLQRRGSNTRGKAAIVLLAVVLVVALGATSFLVISVFVSGKPHFPGKPITSGTAKASVAVTYAAVIPILQWGVLYAAELLLWLLALLARRRTRHSG